MERRSLSYELETDAEEAKPLPLNQRLLIAILFRAVRDFVHYRSAKEGTPEYEVAADAAGWIWWDGEQPLEKAEPMTFRYICRELDLDVEKIRRLTRRLTVQELKRMTRDADLGED